MSAKPGRNDPCWCGSGKKYKKCHLDGDEAVARARARELADARRDVAQSAAVPPGITVRATPPSEDPQDAVDDALSKSWLEADLDARVAILRGTITGEPAASSAWIFDALVELSDDLRGAARTADLDALLTEITTRRADCIEEDGGFYDAMIVENALLRGEPGDALFRDRARAITEDPAGLGLVELLAFHGADAVLREAIPEVLPRPVLVEDEGDDQGDDEATPEDVEAEDEADLAEKLGAMREDIAFLVADLQIARAVVEDPDICAHPEALRDALGEYIPLELSWFERVLRRHAGVDDAPFTAADFESEEEGHVEDATILATHDFFRWLRSRTDWPLSRLALARMSLADMLLHHLETLRQPSRKALLVPAHVVLRYAGDAEHAGSSVALLLASAWWIAFLVERGWVDAVEASRELRLLRREWPAIVGTAGTPTGDPVLGAALKGFWGQFPATLLEPKGSLPPRAP